MIRSSVIPLRSIAKDATDVPPHVLAGRKALEELRQRDPKLVATTEKFFLVQ